MSVISPETPMSVRCAFFHCPAGLSQGGHRKGGVSKEASPSVTALVSRGCYGKVHELAGFNNRRGFLTGLTSGKSKVKALAEVLSGRDTLPDLHMATFWLCPHMAETERAQVSSFSYKGTGPILGASPEPAHLSELPK